jgi:protein-S-isoprenylcysteine O-methyltransferase Ste14
MEREGRPPGVVRHLLAILTLPAVVVIVVPAAILARADADLEPAPLTLAGGLLFAAGLVLWAVTVVLLARIGRGTLAPWDPTRRLVVVGPYRRVRNPMITGVLAMLIGEAALFESVGILIWAGIFFLLNAAWFVAVEEPGLRSRFGEEYAEYARTTPRWIPRLGGGRRRTRGDLRTG